MNRNHRRAMKRNAVANATMLARCCFDYNGKAMLPVASLFFSARLEGLRSGAFYSANLIAGCVLRS